MYTSPSKRNSFYERSNENSVTKPRNNVLNHSREKQPNPKRIATRSKYINFCSDEASLQKEIESLITQIQNCSIKYCQLNEEFDNTKEELDEVKRKYDKTYPVLKEDTQRIVTKARNVQRDIKREQWTTNAAKTENNVVKTSLEDWRRVNMKYNRHMLRISETCQRSRNQIERVEKKAVNSREQQKNLLSLYKKNLFESVNMRKAVLNETEFLFRKADVKLLDKPTLGNFLTKFEKYETDAKELLKHRLTRDTNKTRNKSTAIQNYVRRMEELDKSFAEIKHNEGISDIDEIEDSLIRMIEQKYEVYWKMYEVSNVKQKFIAENKWITKFNAETRDYLEKLNKDNIDYEMKHEMTDHFLNKQHSD